MALSKNQKHFLEALSTYLDDNVKLGLQDNELNDLEKVNGLEYQHNDIQQDFRKMLINKKIIYVDPIMQAFSKVHNYKYFDSPSFRTAMEKELRAQGIDSGEIVQALDLADELFEKLKSDAKDWSEKDSGLFSKMDEIKDVSQPEQPNKFSIMKTDLNKKNIEDINAEFE